MASEFRKQLSSILSKNKTYGREKIELPLDSLDVESIKAYLPVIMSKFDNNKKEIDYLIDYENGCQDILAKDKITRAEINNKPVENHAFELVEFLKGYLVGNPIGLSQRNSSSIVDDITMLNNYMTEQNKAKKDEKMVENIAIFGKHLYLVLPREKNEIENIDKQSPFKIISIDPREGDVIYSSGFEKKKIGCFLVNRLSDLDYMKYGYRNEIIFYVPNKIITVKITADTPTFSNPYTGDLNITEESWRMPYVPMVEYYFLDSRIGIMEVVKDSLDLLNKINANEMDDIEQFVNSIMVLKNQDIKEKDLKLLKSDKILKLKSVNPQMEADVQFLQQSLQHGDINTFYERVYTMMMSIVAIPRANDNVTSGGDTGQARLLGEGWTLADQRALTYQNMISSCERELLEVALFICRNTEKCAINELYPSDVDVKFNISKSDNMLVKSQTMLNLKTLKLPNDIIAEKSQLFNDPLEVAKKWDKNEEEEDKKALENATNMANISNTNNTSSSNSSNSSNSSTKNTSNSSANNQDNRTKNV